MDIVDWVSGRTSSL